MFGQARVTMPHVPRNTCRHEPLHTPEHKSTWNCSHPNALPPTWTLPAAHTTLSTTFYIGLEPQKRWFQKGTKVRKRGVAVFGQARGRTGEGGVPARSRGCVHQTHRMIRQTKSMVDGTRRPLWEDSGRQYGRGISSRRLLGRAGHTRGPDQVPDRPAPPHPSAAGPRFPHPKSLPAGNAPRTHAMASWMAWPRRMKNCNPMGHNPPFRWAASAQWSGGQVRLRMFGGGVHRDRLL